MSIDPRFNSKPIKTLNTAFLIVWEAWNSAAVQIQGLVTEQFQAVLWSWPIGALRF